MDATCTRCVDCALPVGAAVGGSIGGAGFARANFGAGCQGTLCTRSIARLTPRCCSWRGSWASMGFGADFFDFLGLSQSSEGSRTPARCCISFALAGRMRLLRPDCIDADLSAAGCAVPQRKQCESVTGCCTVHEVQAHMSNTAAARQYGKCTTSLQVQLRARRVP